MKMGLRMKLVLSFLQKTASQNNPKTPLANPGAKKLGGRIPASAIKIRPSRVEKD